MVHDTDIHQLNLLKLKLKLFLDEIALKNVFFCICLVVNA
jgi:hypothetical protein